MINNVVLMGRLTADPELRTTTSGTSVTSFNLAVERDYKAAGKERETDFIPIVAWRSTADFITRYFHKGDLIAIVGSVQSRNYEDKNGNKRTAIEICAERASFCGGKNNNAEEVKPPILTDFESVADDDGLPF